MRSRSWVGRRWSWGSRDDGDLRRSLALYEELDDLARSGERAQHDGRFRVLAGGVGRGAGLRYEQARELARRTGNTVLGAFCTTNIGEIALDRGEIEVATALFQEAAAGLAGRGGSARLWRSRSLLLGRALGGAGRFAEALELLERGSGGGNRGRCAGGRPGGDGAGCRVPPDRRRVRRGARDGRRRPCRRPVARRRRGADAAAATRERSGLGVAGPARRGARDALDASLRPRASRHAGYEIALTMRSRRDSATMTPSDVRSPRRATTS